MPSMLLEVAVDVVLVTAAIGLIILGAKRGWWG